MIIKNIWIQEQYKNIYKNKLLMILMNIILYLLNMNLKLK